MDLNPPPPVPPLPEPRLAPELGEVPWRARETIPVVGLAFVSTLFLSLIAFAALGVKTNEENTTYILAAGMLSEAAFGFWPWAWVRLRYDQGLARLGVRRGSGNIGIGLLAGVIGLFASWIITSILFLILDTLIRGPVQAPDQLPKIGGGTETALAVIMVVVIAPIGEELLFRGFLYQALRRWKGVMVGSVISAIIFGMVHADFPELYHGIANLDAARIASAVVIVLPITILGFVLAQVFERRASIIPCMVAHGFYNLIGVLIILRYG